MRTAVDTSVILDVLAGPPSVADAALNAIRSAASEGSLIVCEYVVAEMAPALPQTKLESLLADWQLLFVPSSYESAALAGRMFASYLARRRVRRPILADFLIGAHAQVHAERLLARDRGYLRDCFKDLEVIIPTE